MAASTGWTWLLELVFNLIPHKSHALLKSTTNDWALLPELALNLILHKLQQLPDCVRFASVCTTWRTAAKNAGNMQFQVPMLLFQIRDYKMAKTLLFSVQENKTYSVRLRLPLNKRTKPTVFCSSLHGWLSIVDSDFSITLSSPTTTESPQRATIRLPPVTNINDQYLGLTPKEQEFISTSPQVFIHKVLLSANPTATSDYFVVVIYGFRKQLAILRSGDGNWIYLDKSLGMFKEAAWHKNKLYAVTDEGVVMQIDGVTSKNLNPSIVYSTKYSPEKYFKAQFYLVESSRGELLLVERYFDPRKLDRNGWLITSGFKVHRLEMSPVEEMKKLPHPKVWPASGFLSMRVSEEANMVEVNEIGGDALFLGDNYSMAVAASEMSQCRRNCIYYTKESAANEMGIFCLENGKFETLYNPNPPRRTFYPSWFTPILSDWI